MTYASASAHAAGYGGMDGQLAWRALQEILPASNRPHPGLHPSVRRAARFRFMLSYIERKWRQTDDQAILCFSPGRCGCETIG